MHSRRSAQPVQALDRSRCAPPAPSSGTPATARLVVVDAIDEAAARFYEHHGFIAMPGNRQRLVQKIGDIAAALGR
jgi:hypothetical protein